MSGSIRRRGRVTRTLATRPPLRRFFWTLGRLYAGQPLKAGDIAREFEVGLRTAYRDIDFIRDSMAVPFDFDRSTRSYRLTSPAAPLPPVLLSQGELIAIFFAEKVLRQYKGTPYERNLASAFHKIEALLPEQVKVVPEHVLSYLTLDLGPVPESNPDVFQRVVDALLKRRRLLVRYRSLSSNRTLDRVIEPYRIFNLKGTWYVAAFDHRRRAVRDFALHRIRKAVLTEERFDPNPDFKFNSYMADAFSIEKGTRPLNVAIRFAPRQSRWIRERPWHPSARIQDRLDGGCVLRFRVPLTSELTRWVMQYGPDAEVISPKALRKEVALRVVETTNVYK